jgi:tRNA threonylcarbamoyladenosine biosynthesis protein TsaB
MAVALQCGADVYTRNAAGGAAASAQLIPCIRGLMQQAQLGFAQLQAIGFGRGPGAFTGLRTACAVAQGLAFGAALPVLPLDSLLIVAEGVRVQTMAALGDEALDVHVAMDARMGEVYAGHYRWAGQRWSVLGAPALYTLDALNAAWQRTPPRCVAGSALAVFGERLRCAGARRIGGDVDRAAALMRLAQQAWRDDQGIDAALALPVYLRDKVAQTLAERQAQLAAGVDR